MVKDYAKRKPSIRIKKKPSAVKKAVVILVLLIGASFLAKVLFDHFAKAKHKNTIAPLIVTAGKDHPSFPPENQPTTKVQFDFYTTLPKEKVTVNSKNTSTKSSSKYHLEVTRIADRQDAIHLKNDLAALGFDAFITSGENGINIINIGPYYSTSIAKSDQTKLLAKNIASILKKN